MGYSTDFSGQIKIEPPLNQAERDYLVLFSQTRHIHRGKGPFYVSSAVTDCDAEDVINENVPPPGQPSLYCDFEPTVDGTSIEWTGAEKTQCAKEWITYLITRFLERDAVVSGQNLPEFEGFQFNHVLNGELFAQGEEPSDHWKLVVKDNKVSVKKGKTTYR